MSMNKRSKKSLVLTLGLVFGGLYASTNDIYAAEKEIVTASSLNVRKGPSIEEDVISSVKEGTVLEVLESSKGWNKVRLSDESEGWVSADYTQKEKGKVTATKLNVRKGPSIEDEKIGSIDNGIEVEILEEEDNWFKVKIDKENTGWISGEYVLTESEAMIEAENKAQASVESKNETVVESVTQNTQTNNNTQNNNTVVEEKEEQETSQNTSTGRIMNVVATAYTGHSITAIGTTPKWGTIAVDPSVIPYGTKVYIPKFDKVFIAEDCGGAIKGNKIDIFMDDEGSVYNWGRQTIEIQILGK